MPTWPNIGGLRSLSLAWLGGMLLLWHWLVAGALSSLVAALLLSFVVGCYFLGDLFVGFVLRGGDPFDSLSARVGIGIVLANVLLYVLVLALPFGPAVDWLVLFVLTTICWTLARRNNPDAAPPTGGAPEGIFLLLAPVGITFWCRELLSPVQTDGPMVVIRAWQDIYYHLCEIAGFAASRGLGTISDFHMAGAPAAPYHQGAYMLSAALVDATGISALASYACLLVPVGLLAAALASFSLAASVFGRWPALAAGLALILLPDAAQHGAGNPFFGYHWMMQSAPACGYGVACAAIVFMLLHEACRTGRYQLLAGAYLFGLFTLLHKAQIFFAIAYFALIYPPLFFPGLTARRRVAWGALVTLVYWAVTTVSQGMPGVPLIRLDGSGLMPYSRMVLNNQTAGNVQQVFRALFAASAGVWPWRAAVFALLLTLGTFGLYAILYLGQVRQLRRSVAARVWTIPLLVGVLYLVMATCLAWDDRKVGTPEELLHRPFVWAYYIVVLWGAAVTYLRCFGNAAPSTAIARWSLPAAVLTLFLVPLKFGAGIQTQPNWGFLHQRFPAGLVNVATYIRANSQARDVVQNSQNNTGIVLAALSERTPFAISTNGIREPAGLPARLAALEELKNMREDRQVDAFMKQHSIRWYVTCPGDQVRWADTIGKPPAYESGGYRAYRF